MPDGANQPKAAYKLIDGLTENLEALLKHVDEAFRLILSTAKVYNSPGDQWHWFLESIFGDIPTAILNPRCLLDGQFKIL